MSSTCAAKGVVVVVAVGRRRCVTKARGGDAPTRPHRGRVAAWRGGGGSDGDVDGGTAGVWRRLALVTKWGAAGSGQEFGERLRVTWART
jgi:hypothetical protein